MGTLANLKRRASLLDERVITNEVFAIVRRAQTKIVKLNQEQLQQGLDARGNELFSSVTKRGTYSKATEIISGGRKKEGDHYTLFDTGEFYQGLQLFASNDAVLFASTDSKNKKLVYEFGIEIHGLNDDNLKAVIQSDVLPFLQIYIRKQLDL